MPENSSSSSAKPLALVAVGLVTRSWTPLAFAITVDVATEEVCGLGVHADIAMARMHAICDTVRDNGWCVTHGRPAAFASYHNHCIDADRIAAQLCGSQFRYNGGACLELMEGMTGSLADHLEDASKRGRSFERLYCEAISWAIDANKFRCANPTLPALDWWEMDKNAGEFPPIVKVFELPDVVCGSSEPGGQVELDGARFHHPWLETFSQQGFPWHLQYTVCRFPGNDNELWVIDDGGCFAATRVLPTTVEVLTP